MREYELTFIVRSDVEEPDLVSMIDRVKSLVSDNGGEVTKIDQWGTRRLAYPVRNLRDGQYVFMLTKLPPNAIVEVDRTLNLIDEIVRHLLVRVDE